MTISPDILIMTRAEFKAAEDRAFHRGVARGRFEQGCENSQRNTPSEGPSKTKLPASPDAGGGPIS